MDRRRRVPPPRALIATLLAAALTGCGGSSGATAQGTGATAQGAGGTAQGAGVGAPSRAAPAIVLSGGPPAHVAVIVMENEEYGDVIGSPAAPFINELTRRYALARSMYAVTHPSLPNYLALTGGSSFGISSDCTSCAVHASSIVNRLAEAHISWKAYMEDLPHPCFTGASAGEYAKKHDPFAYYAPVTSNRGWCARIVGLDQLAADERHRTLPRFIWITPNLCHDMHDCSVATGDRFLRSLVPPLLRSLGRDGLVFLTWDEGSSDAGCCRLAAGGHIVTIVAGPGARPGARMSTPADHYSVLRTIEDLLGLRRLRGAACGCTPSLRPLLAVARAAGGRRPAAG